MKKHWIWPLLPALSVIVVLFGGSLFFAAAESFGFFSPLGGGLTTGNFRRLRLDPEVRAAFLFTLYVTTLATLLSAAGGTLLALVLRRPLAESATLKTLLQFPLAVPHLVTALILLHFLAPSGFIARLFYAAGLIVAPTDFPALVNDAYGVGVISSYVIRETPFIALIVLTILVRVGDDFEQVARTLGASAWQRFRFVTLPLIAPAVVFSSMIVWTFIFGAFEIPFVLGRSYPAMLSIHVQREFNSTDLTDRPAAMALAVVMTAVTTLFVWLYLRLTRNHTEVEKTTLF